MLERRFRPARQNIIFGLGSYLPGGLTWPGLFCRDLFNSCSFFADRELGFFRSFRFGASRDVCAMCASIGLDVFELSFWVPHGVEFFASGTVENGAFGFGCHLNLYLGFID